MNDPDRFDQPLKFVFPFEGRIDQHQTALLRGGRNARDRRNHPCGGPRLAGRRQFRLERRILGGMQFGQNQPVARPQQGAGDARRAGVPAQRPVQFKARTSVRYSVSSDPSPGRCHSRPMPAAFPVLAGHRRFQIVATGASMGVEQANGCPRRNAPTSCVSKNMLEHRQSCRRESRADSSASRISAATRTPAGQSAYCRKAHRAPPRPTTRAALRRSRRRAYRRYCSDRRRSDSRLEGVPVAADQFWPHWWQ